MSLVFTDDFKKKFEPDDSPYDGSFIKKLTLNENLSFLRNRIEKAIAKYPQNKRTTMIDNLHSFSEIICRSSLSELYTFDILHKNYDVVNVEKPLNFVNNKTPDFWVNENLVFEVLSTFEEEKPKEGAIKEAINSIKTNYKIVLGPIKRLTENEYPKLSEVREYFLKLLKDDSRLNSLKSFQHKFSQGFVLSGKIYRGKKEHATVGAEISGAVINNNYISSVRNRIEKKVKKYSDVSKSDFPFIVVLFNYNDFLGFEDILSVLFGDEKYSVNMDTLKEWYWRENSMIQENKNTSLSAILVRKKSTLDEFYLYENPYARVPIDSHVDKIITAFKAERINA